MVFSPSKQSIVAFVILLVTFLLTYPYIFDVKLFLGGDNCNYYILADGLASGDGYVSKNLPFPAPANHFPPGYPFIMSLFMRIGISSIIAFKVINGIFLLLTSFVFYRIVRQLTKFQVLSIVLAVFVLLNSHVLEYSTIMMSEIPFMLFQLLSVYFLMKWHEEDYKVKSAYGLAFVIVLIGLIYIRTMGITMLGASVLFILFSKRYLSALLVFSVVFLALLPWQMRSSNLGGSPYVKSLFRVNPYDASTNNMDLSDWGTRVKKNAVRYASKEIPSSIFPGITVVYTDPATKKLALAPASHWALGIIIMLLTLLGIWSVPRYRWLFLFIFGSSILIYLLWPDVWFGIRFILPMVPLILLFSVLGIYFILEKIFRKKENLRTSPYLALSFLILLVPQISGIKKLHTKKESPHPKNWANYIELAEWTKENLKDAVISTRKPGIFYTQSGHPSLSFQSTSNREDFLKFFNDNKVTHVVIEQLGFGQTGKYLLPIVQSDNQQFQLVKSLSVVEGKDKDGKPLKSPAAVWLFDYKPEFGYSGEYKDGKRHGKGVYKFRDGRKMEGQWNQDTLAGPGVFHDFEGKTFTGVWKDGKKDGMFIISQPGKASIETYWQLDKPKKIGFLLDENGERVQEVNLF